MVSLKSVQVLSHDHLHHMYRRLVLANLGIEVCFETFAVMGSERYGRSDIEIMEKVGNMKHYRVAGLQRGQSACGGFLDNGDRLASVTPNSFTVALP